MPFGRALALVQLTALGYGPAGASGPTAVRIEFDGPAQCSDAARFYARVRARTERVRSAGPNEAGLRIQVRLQQPASGKVHGELRILDERGEASTRSVDGASCEEVVEALSLTAALALDPTATLTSSTSPPSADAPGANGDASKAAASASAAADKSAAPKSAQSSATKPAVSTPSDATAVDVKGGADGATNLGAELGANLLLTRVVSPHLNFGVGAFGRLTLRDAERVTASLGLVLAYSGNVLSGPDETLSLRLTSLTLHVCPLRAGDVFTLELCALGSGGLLAASSSGISHPDSSLRSYFTVGGLVRAALSVTSRLRLELEAAAFAPLLYRNYVLSSPQRLLGETPGVSATGALGASYGF